MRYASLSVLGAMAILAAMGLSCQAFRPPVPLGRPLAEGESYDQPPVPITKVQAQYPEFAREAQISGTVVIHVLIGRSGRVENAKVIRGVTGLTDAAMAAARQWDFQPAIKNHSPVAAWYEIEFDFPP